MGIIKHSINENYFASVDTGTKAYWLGFIAADGCIRELAGKKLRLTIELSSRDRFHLELFRLDINSSHPIATRIKRANPDLSLPERESCYLSITRKKFVLPIAAMHCKASDVFDRIPAAYIRDFIRGFSDGDGCFHRENSKPQYTGYCDNQISWILASPSQCFLKRLKQEISKIDGVGDPSIRPQGNIWRLKYKGSDQISKIQNYLYSEATRYLERKRFPSYKTA